MSLLLQSEQLRELAEKILTEIPRPKDHWEIAARLEIFGIRDVDAREEYGTTDVFDLAELLFSMIEKTLGALAFLLVSSYYTRQVFSNLDYYYYSAY